MPAEPPIPPAPDELRGADSPPVKQARPFVTWLVCAACIVAFLGLQNEAGPDSWEKLAKWGCYPGSAIYDGGYWALFTSVFVHLEPWHVAFNVYWLWIFGRPLEEAIGSRRFLAFFVSAGVISSAAELAIIGDTGIGASGVVYALFGFLWVTRKHFPGFRAVLAPRTTALFLIWLAACFVMTWTKVWTVGNEAHLSGLLFGAGLGAYVIDQRRRRIIATGLASLCLVSIVSIFWAPWSPDWSATHANRAYDKGDFDSAIHWYQRSLNLGHDKIWCWHCIALAYGCKGDKPHYEEALRRLRALDEKAAREVEQEFLSKMK